MTIIFARKKNIPKPTKTLKAMVMIPPLPMLSTSDHQGMTGHHHEMKIKYTANSDRPGNRIKTMKYQ